MRATHLDAEQRYNGTRNTVIFATQQRLQQDSAYRAIRLAQIDRAALIAAKQWELSPNRHTDWNWFEGYSAFRFAHPKRFELAIWENNELISLTLGRPTYHGTAMRMDFLEAAPDYEGRIKIFPIAFLALMAYARALGAVEVRLVKPINETVRRYYERHGLIYVAKGDYLYRKL